MVTLIVVMKMDRMVVRVLITMVVIMVVIMVVNVVGHKPRLRKMRA